MTAESSLWQRRLAAIPDATTNAFGAFIASAQGSQLWDTDGRRYIDFASGIGVNNVGHLHPEVVSAITEQLQKFAHVAFTVAPYEKYVEVCEQLNRLAPIKDAKSVLFTTGAEAAEAAIKVARVTSGRRAVIAFSGAFHGRTYLASAMTGKIAPLRGGESPDHAGVYHAPFPASHFGVTETESLRAIERLFKSSIAPEQVAAIAIEVVQGEGGFNPVPHEFLREIRAICTRHGISLVVDEIQSGFGRTGKFFAVEHFDIEADLILVGKALGGGLPLSGLIGRASLMDAVAEGTLGGTFQGNPLACAAALATIRVIENEGLLLRALEIGGKLVHALQAVRHQPGILPIANIRNMGAMVAFDVFTQEMQPDAAATQQVAQRAFRNGVVLLPCGYFGNTLRISTPLTISDQHLNEGVQALSDALLTPVVEGHAERVSP